MMNKSLILFFIILVGCSNNDDNIDRSQESQSSVEVSDTSSETLGELNISQQGLISDGNGIIDSISQFFTWILVSLFSLLIVILFFIIHANYKKRIKDINNEIKELKINKNHIYKNINSKIDSGDLDNYLKDYRREITQQKKQIKSLYSEIIDIKNQIGRSNQSYSETIVENFEEKLNYEELKEDSFEKSTVKTKYFTVPDEDGKFNDQRAAEDSSGSMIYFRITHERDSNIGNLNYNQGRIDQTAIDKRDSILKPVCDIINPETVNPSRIHQIHPGKVELTDGLWVVREKVQIEFL